MSCSGFHYVPRGVLLPLSEFQHHFLWLSCSGQCVVAYGGTSIWANLGPGAASSHTGSGDNGKACDNLEKKKDHSPTEDRPYSSSLGGRGHNFSFTDSQFQNSASLREGKLEWALIAM